MFDIFIFLATASIFAGIGYLFGWNIGVCSSDKLYKSQNDWLFKRCMALKNELDERKATESKSDDADWWKK